MSMFFLKKTMSMLGVTFLTAGVLFAGSAYAENHERDMHHDRDMNHGHYDNRFHHGHYYPELGYRLEMLPPGYLRLAFGGRNFFFLGGVWYVPTPTGYIVARPPIGIITPSLPLDYSTIYVGGRPYYYANETYYVATQGGYVVANPPSEGTYVEAPPAQSPSTQAIPSAEPQPQPGMWYFCESANTYYPYIASCKEGWKTVPAIAPTPH